MSGVGALLNQMLVRLIAHTQFEKSFRESLEKALPEQVADGQITAFTAIRTCYSPEAPTAILAKDGVKYFLEKTPAGDTRAERLFSRIARDKHLSTLEHLSFTFAVEGISRACLAQLSRHRHISLSVQSQRYVDMKETDFVIPPSIGKSGTDTEVAYMEFVTQSLDMYRRLREGGVPPEDARMVLPAAVTTNLVLTMNLRAALEFYQKRRKGSGAQWEIAELAEEIRREIERVEPWAKMLFEEVAGRSGRTKTWGNQEGVHEQSNVQQQN